MASNPSVTEGNPVAPDAVKDQGESAPTSQQFNCILGLLLLYFAGRLVFYAVSISGFVPPDEVTHLGLCRVFSNTFLLPHNSPETYRYGLVTNVPWLYYWVMGKLLLLNVIGVSDLLFLRLLNIPLAFGTVYFAWRTLRLLTDDHLAEIVLVVAITNTCMFSFLSASVSYDNLTNLLAAMAIFFLAAFFREGSVKLLAGSLLCQLAGCLTKSSFLPLVLVLNLLLVIHVFRSLPAFRSSLAAWFHDRRRQSLVLAFGILVGFVLNLQLYGGNLLQYKALAPEMHDVLPAEAVMQNRIGAREMILSSFKEQRISFGQAMEMASQIDHPGDRQAAFYLIQNYVQYTYGAFRLMNPVSYLLPWAGQMTSTVFGIMGHRSMFNAWPTILPIYLLMVLTALAVLLRWRPRKEQLLPSSLGGIAAFYGIFLLYAVNYRTYLEFASFPLALQGRYIFPVLVPIYVVSSFYLMRLANGRYARLVLAAAVALILVASDFPFFLTHVTPEWFSKASM